MAWNEPGGGGRDPWGNQGDKGPPDLDEAFRKLKSQLTGIFGGGRSGGGSGNGKLSTGLLGAGLVALAAIYGFFGLYQIDQGERGVVFRFGAVQQNIVMPGLHWNPPLIDRVRKVNVTQVRSKKHQALMLTEDENIVDVSMTVQYVVDDPIAFLVKVRNPEVSLDHATESALRHVAGGSIMDQVITDGRAAIAVEVQERLQSYLNRYETGILVSKVNIDESAPPSQVRDAFNDVQKAKEDEQRVINEANAYAESIIPTARGEAQKLIEQANAYRDQVVARSEGEAQRFEKLLAEYSLAKEVTRDRLYLDSIESVLSTSSKIMVDVEGGNNLMYLPLDRFVQSGAGAGGTVTQDTVRNLADAVIREINSRVADGRGRDAR
ncbi:MAG: FtsH protease activity modulator HflK [Gammaproteobacteria bacterium]|nr:FtsH protease activity modulator HflK [Gammaproteobacteria bacterium]MXW51064.1 FtsH protease activity modulator HflK [Gammaproteobacteria bacterium]MXY05596.1 FtsH protease activity modulator HflK [Gammaproteobacteria bacterium]MYE50577.1 FtsH protease activity modulator HflK [Gammaproteobacteria bacterium]MYF11105.1 FtsH protease activity modulator HflK [Gammaproteobacteria bacterium]